MSSLLVSQKSFRQQNAYQKSGTLNSFKVLLLASVCQRIYSVGSDVDLLKHLVLNSVLKTHYSNSFPAVPLLSAPNL